MAREPLLFKTIALFSRKNACFSSSLLVEIKLESDQNKVFQRFGVGATEGRKVMLAIITGTRGRTKIALPKAFRTKVSKAGAGCQARNQKNPIHHLNRQP